MPDWKTILESNLAKNSNSVDPPAVQLPILPKALTEFQKKSEDPEADTDELSRIIASDAGLSTELLRNINICMAGSLTKVTSVKQALVMLGIAKTRLYLTTSGMKEVMKSTSSKLINFQNFWNANLERSLFAREIARLLNADMDIAFTAGMLQDFLLPLITNQLVDDYLEFTSDRDSYSNLISFELQKFGWDHAQSAAQVMNAWQFPEELVCCVYFHHRGVGILKDEELKNTSVAAVAIATLIPDAFRQESNSLEALIELGETWPEFDLISIAEAINEEFEQLAGNVKNHFPLVRLLKNKLKQKEALAQIS